MDTSRVKRGDHVSLVSIIPQAKGLVSGSFDTDDMPPMEDLYIMPCDINGILHARTNQGIGFYFDLSGRNHSKIRAIERRLRGKEGVSVTYSMDVETGVAIIKYKAQELG